MFDKVQDEVHAVFYCHFAPQVDLWLDFTDMCM
jgi:hypothetical protein